MTHLKNAIQELDLHIFQLEEIRRKLVELMPEEGGGVQGPRSKVQGQLAPVQTLEQGLTGGTPVPLKRRKKIKITVPDGQRGGAGRVQQATEFSAMSDKMLRAGLKLAEPFGCAEIRKETGCSTKQAHNCITRWTKMQLIKRTDEVGMYRRLAAFAKRCGVAPVKTAEAEKPRLAAVPSALSQELTGGTPVPPGDRPRSLGEAMKREILKLRKFTLETLEKVLEGNYHTEEWHAERSATGISQNLSYWTSKGYLEKLGQGPLASYQVTQAGFFEQRQN